MSLRWREWRIIHGKFSFRFEAGNFGGARTGKTFLPEPEADESGEDSSGDESGPEPGQGGHSGAHQDVLAAVEKLYDSFTGAPQPIMQSRTRSGCDAASLQAPMRAVDVNHLPPEPTTLCEAQASP